MLYLGVPLALSLMVVHCMLPPRSRDGDHRAAGRRHRRGDPVLARQHPTAIIAGPLWVRLTCDRAPSPAQRRFLEQLQPDRR
jgi:GntP family gluconate:H+ symporter/D-serine transporter